MAIGESIALEIVRRLLDAYAKHSLSPPERPRLEELLAEHIAEIAHWTERIEFFGLAVAKDTDRDTIDLFLSIPRKFRGSRSVPPQGEHWLLDSGRNYILLGDPGAGKTTTLKRLTRSVLTQAPRVDTDTSQYPILVRLRELDDDTVLETKLGRILGLDESLLKLAMKADEKERATEKTLQKRFTRSERLATAIGKLLDTSGALVLLDGLDEVPGEIRSLTERMISRLVEKCGRAHVIVSCRSGDYNAHLTNLDVVELSPLDSAQIREVVHRWTRTPEDFLAKLHSQSFLDLASRPLFLCQLLVLYEERGFIPDQPTDVVDLIVRLAIEEWDARHKKLPRRSRYATFDTTKKRDFLAHLAFSLTYELRGKQFTSSSLGEAYAALHERFRLPEGESDAVVREIETHTGIFVDAGHDRFEFSHLSLQEYLTATYLVREPINKSFLRYLVENPAPVAVATALAPRPERWLPRVLLNSAVAPSLRDLNLRAFFARVLQERPQFVADRDLGFLALAILNSAVSGDDYVRRFLTEKVVENSTAQAIEFYTLTPAEGGYDFTLGLGAALPEEIAVPPRGRISSADAERLRPYAVERFVGGDRRNYGLP